MCSGACVVRVRACLHDMQENKRLARHGIRSNARSLRRFRGKVFGIILEESFRPDQTTEQRCLAEIQLNAESRKGEVIIVQVYASLH